MSCIKSVTEAHYYLGYYYYYYYYSVRAQTDNRDVGGERRRCSLGNRAVA